MQRRFTLKALTAAVALTGLSALSAHAQSAGTIKVGILHSLSGTMAISETAASKYQSNRPGKNF